MFRTKLVREIDNIFTHLVVDEHRILILDTEKIECVNC